MGSPTASLTACQTALSEQRQATIAYDNALRAIPFTGDAATDASHLLSDDAAIETLLEQAATAPSLATIASVQHAGHPAACHRGHGRDRAARGHRAARSRLTRISAPER